MIEQFEKSPSSKASCKMCKRTILTGRMRGIEYVFHKGNLTKRFYCKRCSKEIIKSLFRKAEENLGKLKIK